MRVTLLHNVGAGTSDEPTERIVAALADAGIRSVATPEYDKSRLGAILVDPGDLVVAVGGDGTAAAVATALVGRGIPFAILPRGTANNVARTFDVPTDLSAWATGLPRARRVAVDVGRATGSWGLRRFVESAGVGLFHHVMTEHASEDDKEPPRAARIIREALDGYAAREWNVTLDGVDHSGAYLLVEAMNVRSIGPNLCFAPDADPGDGLFDVALLAEADRARLAAYLDRLADEAGGAVAMPALDARVVRARHVQIELAGATVRVDDKERPRPEQPAADRVDLTLEPAAVTLWVPS
jgi:diacylglycerol kinase (ATP)